ncbi:MAG: thioredoxin family protein [Deltaproteobacteria bacterium]|nr:thioredoxin family protein [Deltaproteobacteria bacterium]
MGILFPIKKVTLTLSLALVLVIGAYSWAAAGQFFEANAGQGGQRINISTLAVKGQITLIEFSSPFCPPCVRLAPRLEQLAQRSNNLVIIRLDINRPGFKGIDWKSPLAVQYNLKTVPYFVIYNQKKEKVAQGDKAMDHVEKWLRKAGLAD